MLRMSLKLIICTDKVVNMGFLLGYTNIFECSIKTVKVNFVNSLQSTLESLFMCSDRFLNLRCSLQCRDVKEAAAGYYVAFRLVVQ